MRIPFFPISVDDFGTFEGVSTYFLSHFHTDHLRGLTPSWSSGIIYTSAITRALLMTHFGQEIGRRTVAVPLNVFVQVPLPERRIGGDLELCLLDSNHIPGSVMFYLRTCLGSLLFTGDFKFDETMELAVAPFFAQNRVDHLWLDDTWLHLATSPRRDGLLSRDDLDSAFASIASRVLQAGAEFEQQQAAARAADDEQTGELERLLRLRSRSSPFIVRCYLHNHFGKELLVQRLAKLLGAKVEVDSRRYSYLAAAASAGTSDAVDLRTFEPSARYNYSPRVETARCCDHGDEEAAGPSVVVSTGPVNPCGVVIVNSRADIHPATLEAAQRRCGSNVPHFAVVMSGWARLRKEELQDARVFQVPYTLHCTPAQLLRFVQLLRPKSVLPLHPHRRSNCMMTNLGPLLRIPHTNEVLSASALRTSTIPVTLQEYVLTAAAENVPSRRRPREDVVRKAGGVKISADRHLGELLEKERREEEVQVAAKTREAAFKLSSLLECVGSDTEDDLPRSKLSLLRPLTSVLTDPPFE